MIDDRQIALYKCNLCDHRWESSIKVNENSCPECKYSKPFRLSNSISIIEKTIVNVDMNHRIRCHLVKEN